MRRLLLLGTAFVLVATACGAGASPAPRLSNVAAHPGPGLHAVAAARKREAGRKAEKLLQHVFLPRGARGIAEPPILAQRDTGVSLVSELAWRFAFWRVRMPIYSAFAFFKAHPPRGFEYVGGGGLYRSLDFTNDRAGRLLTIDLARLSGKTVLRVEAGAPWIYPRSPREVVPVGVHEIDIRDGHLTRLVGDPSKIGRIIRWFDALNVVQAGTIGIHCPLILATRAKFVFLSASGARLATAIVPSQPANACDSISFSIRGHRQTPLIDAGFGRRAFVNRVQRLLGLRFPSR